MHWRSPKYGGVTILKVGATKIEGTNYKMGALSKGATKHGEGRHYNRRGAKV